MSRGQVYRGAGGGCVALLLWLAFSLFVADAVAAAKPKLSLGQVKWSDTGLTVKGKLKRAEAATLIRLLDVNGRLLATTSDRDFVLNIPKSQMPGIPCSVRVSAGSLEVLRRVAGAPKECAKTPVCKIISPSEGAALQAAPAKSAFKAEARLKDKKAKPVRYEWDFSGGAMQTEADRTRKLATDALFVRNNARYRVRFSATDGKGRRCEDSVEVTVGTPPSGLPDVSALAKAAQDAQPALGSGLQGDKVVIPFEELSMQCTGDGPIAPPSSVIYGPPMNTVNAYVYQKGLQPQALAADKVNLFYAAASNPADPVGAGSINSTSQNWPLGSPLKKAQLPKTDLFERVQRPPGTLLTHDYDSLSLVDIFSGYIHAPPDEGYGVPNSPEFNPDHGRQMPGMRDPYKVNEYQPFSGFDADNHWFSALDLPLSDTDDSGRVNPFTLFRVQARDAASQAPVATTDTVVTAGRDLHCRECHAKGEIGADPSIMRRNFIGSSAPQFFEPTSGGLLDREFAALKNLSAIHDFNDNLGEYLQGRLIDPGEFGFAVAYDRPELVCSGCHSQPMSTPPHGAPTQFDSLTLRNGAEFINSNSALMHGYHGRLQYNPQRNGVLRDADGLPLRFDLANWDAGRGGNPNSLFPVKDAQGNLLPMEQNCLRCHGGQREQCYRDRMYTAGVTCYQCHGDMLAMGSLFPKAKPNPDGNRHRAAWFDEPDCGSCHTGNGNRGRDKQNGFFSAGVLSTAFDANDPSASPRQVDWFNPDGSRFGVPPHLIPAEQMSAQIGSLQTPLFRLGKDVHGQVACAACHGAAHAIWPNRDPNANDNVTALELQGHVGHLLECSVCHAKDSFAKFADLDEGLKVSNPKPGVLGGPHGMHPVYDENFWKGAALDTTPNAKSGKIKGGWHNDYAKLPGRAGEDQCAACHGNDHRGTRLSKTPVDRLFVTEKGKKIRIKAGTEIGCQHCHSIAKSCTQSPNLQCGMPSSEVAGSTNLPPRITSTAVETLVMGQSYFYPVQATDPEHDALSYRLNPPINGVTIGEDGRIDIPWGIMQPFTTYTSAPPPFPVNFNVVVTDAKGAYAIQPVALKIVCPGGQVWNASGVNCGQVGISSSPPVGGLNAGETFTYPVVGIKSDGSPPITYSLGANKPDGMSIDAASGLITWVTDLNSPEGPQFQVIASVGNGIEARQDVYLAVCKPSMIWWETKYSCNDPIQFDGGPPVSGLNSGERLGFPVKASHYQGRPVSVSLDFSASTHPPAGVTLEGNVLRWDTTGQSGAFDFQVLGRDDQGNVAAMYVYLTVCGPPTHWDGSLCKGPINFTTTGPNGLTAGAAYDYTVATSHEKGLPVSLSLDFSKSNNPPVGMTLKNGVIHWDTSGLSGLFDYQILASDGQGGTETQSNGFWVCKPVTPWDPATVSCLTPVKIDYPTQSQGGDPGVEYAYQVSARHDNGLALTYSLSSDKPAGMEIDSATGLITWPSPVAGDYVTTVTAADINGADAQLPLYITICAQGSWMPEHGHCM